MPERNKRGRSSLTREDREKDGGGWNGSGWNQADWSYPNWKASEEEDRGWGPPKEGMYDFPPGTLDCTPPHDPIELKHVVSPEDCGFLREVWDNYHDNLDKPKLKAKPILSDVHLAGFHRIVMKVVQTVATVQNRPLSLDQATISCTSSIGHKRHADNLVFGVWRYGRRVQGPVEEEMKAARRDGAEVWWKPNTTAHRNYAISINLVDPREFTGGTVKFFRTLGAVEPYASYKAEKGCGVTFCGCDACIHEVEGVSDGFRLCLLIWTRAAGVETPHKSKTTHYHRSGTGDAVWLTLADLKPELVDLAVYPEVASDQCTQEPMSA